MRLSGEMLEEMEHFKYLGSQIGREGGVEVHVSFRVGEAKRAAGTVRKLWKNRGLGVVAKMMIYEGDSCTHGTIWDRNHGLQRIREEKV